MTGYSFSSLTVAVLGASGALGSGLVTAFADAGAAVTAVSPDLPGAAGRRDGVTYMQADVTSDASLADLFRALPGGEPARGAAAGGAPRPWAVVNTVGGYAPQTPLAELDPATLTRQLELNLVSAALVTKHALRWLAPGGQGRIIHTASRAARVPQGQSFAYSVSKLGVLHLVSMAAAETQGSGITVNCVSPSIIDTPANRAAIPGADYDSWPKVPDIAQAYLFLASPAAHLVSGTTISV